jgi:CubicO group peptidase (beta-lactamase class C family)
VAVLIATLGTYAAIARRPATLNATLDAYLSSLAAHQQFSGTVLVAQRGTVVLEKGYGLADRLYRRPNTPATTYPVFGVGDSFSVLGVLHLIETGKLAWQTPVCTYVQACPQSWRPLTVRMVLDGTAGLPAYAWGVSGQTPQWSLQRCQTLPLDTHSRGPGALIRYASCAMLVLGTIIEQVTQGVWEASLLNGTPRAFGVTNTWRLTDAVAASGVARL